MFTMIKKVTLLFAVLLLVGLNVRQSEAYSVVGGSELLSSTNGAQLETWLGQGSLQFTNIFDHVAGDSKTATNFHNSADGKGQTFVLMNVTDSAGKHSTIGGYDPQSWNSSSSWNISTIDSARTAFIFNLTNSFEYSQRLSTQGYWDSGGYCWGGSWGSSGGCSYWNNYIDSGQYQTYDASSYGPSFGAGHDLYSDYTLSQGYAYSYSYGSGRNGSNILGNYGSSNFTIDEMEVFTIAPDTAPVPEPGTMALLGLGMAGLAVYGKRRQNRKA